MGKRLRRVIPLATISVALLMAAACGPRPAGDDDTANSQAIVKTDPATLPTDRGDQVVTGGDLAFLNDAAAGGMAEVALGRLAVERTTNPEVKRFAERVIADHSKAGDELKQLAQRKQVMLPADVNPQHKETLAHLSDLRGAAFDREYVKAMVENHIKDVTAFEAVAKGAVDADVKEFATKTLPTLKVHLDVIQKIAASSGGTSTP